MIRKDILWKGIIEDLAEEFIRFFFAEYIEEIDLSRGFVFLDKELDQLSTESASPGRRADKLFKAWLTDGSEQWFLIHIEVQGYADPDFARRMFQYAYRILDHYDRPLTAVVIYTDANRGSHFSEYRSFFMGTEIIYRFRAFILVDHQPEVLRQTDKLFGWVLEVARRELDLRKDSDNELFNIKMSLVRYLFERGVNRAKIRYLLDFIGAYLPFEKSSFLRKFEQEIQQITKSEKAMGIREAILKEVKERGIEQGIEQKEQTVVTRAWKKGISVQDISELADMPIEKVEAIIRELEMLEDE